MVSVAWQCAVQALGQFCAQVRELPSVEALAILTELNDRSPSILRTRLTAKSASAMSVARLQALT